MKIFEERHPQLEGLKVMWNLPEDMLNTILWVNTAESNLELEKPLAIGYACQYIEYMTEVLDVESPENAWEDWCITYDIEHEIENNPYL